jgi:Tol biopolymer transport system component/DNA-binding winged helix-turn-helix (wHTH) protein
MGRDRSLADLLPIILVKSPLEAATVSSPVDLTLTPDFPLGAIEVRPSTCEVLGDAGAVRLQPRVMQVLIALARSGGEVVSRRALVEACWGDVAVGDDALNRCIQRLRRLSEEEAKGAFVIETVPRLGYRLTAVEAARPTEPPSRVEPHRRYWPFLAGGLVVLTTLSIAGTLLVLSRPARWSIERSEPLVSSPLIERYPALSPDGTMLAYSAGPDTFSRRIYLKRLSGGEPIQLTNDGLDDISPTWSRDGSRIAYSTYRAGETCRIMVIAVPAGLASEVGRCRTAERSPVVWNGSTNRLFLVDAPATGLSLRIFSLDLASGRMAQVDHPPQSADDGVPAISPDGRLLSFGRTSTHASSTRWVIYDLRTGRETWLAHVPPSDESSAWAEDSKSVFLEVDVPGHSELRSYPIDGGSEQRLLTVLSPITTGRLSSGPGGLLAAEYTTGRFNLATLSADGSPQIIDQANDGTWSPAFARDGTLAMASNRAGEQGIWLMRPGGPSRLLLNVKGDGPCCFAWSPDGASFAYIVGDGPPTVRVVTAAGQELARIRVPGTDVGVPNWMADGRSLVFPVHDAGGWRLWRAELGRPDRPAPITGYGWASVRTDGDVLYGVKASEPGIWRIGAPAVKLTDRFSVVRPGNWLIFKHQIIFADQARPDHPRLLTVPVDGGPQHVFADLPKADPEVEFAIDPRTGAAVYVEKVSVDTDIELLHLARQ